MKDKCNREIKHIRFSITSKCNFKCVYCDREGFTPKTSELTVDEITKLCKILAEILNVTRIKFTGGEPLCREEIIQIIQNVSDLHLYKDISMTTNGLLLYEKAQELYNAGLNRINVSLGSLKPEVYKEIYGSDSLEKTLKGLKKAKEVGFNPIKLNFVIMKGINDDELETMYEFCGKNGFILQLIELHEVSDAVGGNGEFYKKHHLDVKPIIEELESRAVKTKIRGSMQNRKVFTLPNSTIVETIAPGHEFCMGCTKLRIGCDGDLFGCLFRSDLGKNLKEALHNHHSLEKYEQIVKQVVDSREPYY
ncbi:MAG: GTP 3',8-cyclase MoaA [Candidatus Lokiarchaeota archaeon]|nr:GTP 3',8-cyclase MoaA [Candidatus Lokiarchaeota archaeon]MCK4479189.1 GTP 3',8-cyclase MoaA [Candidatus Lokiarchaeota archaeon]